MNVGVLAVPRVPLQAADRQDRVPLQQLAVVGPEALEAVVLDPPAVHGHRDVLATVVVAVPVLKDVRNAQRFGPHPVAHLDIRVPAIAREGAARPALNSVKGVA